MWSRAFAAALGTALGFAFAGIAARCRRRAAATTLKSGFLYNETLFRGLQRSAARCLKPECLRPFEQEIRPGAAHQQEEEQRRGCGNERHNRRQGADIVDET